MTNTHTLINDAIVKTIYTIGLKNTVCLYWGKFISNFLLWKFSSQRLLKWSSWVCRTSYTHCLIYVRSTAQRISNRAAKASRCAAKRSRTSFLVFAVIRPTTSFPALFFALYLKSGIKNFEFFIKKRNTQLDLWFYRIWWSKLWCVWSFENVLRNDILEQLWWHEITTERF